MKITFPVLICLSLLFLCIGSCKKDNNSQSETTKYRLITTNFYGEEGHISQTNYSFVGNKVSYREGYDGSATYLADYSYEDGKVYAAVHITEDSTHERESTLEYVYENNLLVEINSWHKSDQDSTLHEQMVFEYSGGKMVEYIQNIMNESYAKATYEYSGENLVVFTFYYFIDNEWAKWNEDVLNYDGDKLSEVITSMAIIDPSNFVLLSKKVYVYENEIPKQIMGYADENGSWVHRYNTDLFYDGNNNLIKEEHKYSHDSSMMYYYEYQYEEGESNLGEINYLSWAYPVIQYPIP